MCDKKTINLTCIYCKTNSFDYGQGSEEHAILSSLGGKKKSRNICCIGCNTRLGKEIDEPLSKQFSIFSTMFGVIRDRKKNALTQKNMIKHENQNYNMTPGGKFELSRSDVQFHNSDNFNQESFSITVNNKQKALKLLSQILRKYDKSIDDYLDLKAVKEKFYLPKASFTLSLRKTEFRSIAKMLLTYLATTIDPVRIRNGQFDKLIEYINTGNNNYPVVYDSISPIPEQPKLHEINHRIFIFASKKRKVVFGVIELFGHLRFSTVLTNKWDGEDINKVYVIDPTIGKHKEETVKNFEEIFDSINDRKINENHLKDAIFKIIGIHQKQTYERSIKTIIDEAISNNLTKGEIITSEQLNSLVEELSCNFTKYILRLPSSEKIDLIRE